MYHIEFSGQAKKQFKKLDKHTQQMIGKYIDKNLESVDNPRKYGKALAGTLRGLWRYEVGKYRLICEIKDGVLQILVLKIGHRREVYR